jgi:AAA family ATP:ADP antiporter
LRHPTASVVVVFQVIRKALHYAVDRPARETLYTILDPDAKYKSKSFIDTYIYRGGDFIGAWGPNVLATVSLAAPLVAIPLGFVWLSMGLLAGIWHSRAIRGRDAGYPSR